eukprot:m51a1_g6020 hypothetical protein (798) ;mRNA; f:80156-83516
MAWTQFKSKLPAGMSPVCANFAGCAFGGKAVTFCGLAADSASPVNRNFQIDPSGQWTTLSTSGVTPTARHGHSSDQFGPTKLLILGGATAADSAAASLSNEVFTLNIGLKSWMKPRVTGDAPPAIAHHRTVLINNNIVLSGGLTSVGPSADVYVLNMTRMAWTKPHASGTAPSARYQHCVAPVPGSHDTFVVFGGTDGTNYFNDCAAFNFVSGAWSAFPTQGDAPSPRANAGYAAVGNVLYVFGGRGAGGALLDDLWGLDIPSATWTFYGKDGGPWPSARDGHSLVPIGGTSVMLVGGQDPSAVWQLAVNKLKAGGTPGAASPAPATSPVPASSPPPAAASPAVAAEEARKKAEEERRRAAEEEAHKRAAAEEEARQKAAAAAAAAAEAEAARKAQEAAAAAASAADDASRQQAEAAAAAAAAEAEAARRRAAEERAAAERAAAEKAAADRRRTEEEAAAKHRAEEEARRKREEEERKARAASVTASPFSRPAAASAAPAAAAAGGDSAALRAANDRIASLERELAQAHARIAELEGELASRPTGGPAMDSGAGEADSGACGGAPPPPPPPPPPPMGMGGHARAPSSLGGEEGGSGGPPPPPPPPPMGGVAPSSPRSPAPAGRADLLAQINAGKRLRHANVAPRPQLPVEKTPPAGAVSTSGGGVSMGDIMKIQAQLKKKREENKSLDKLIENRPSAQALEDRNILHEPSLPKLRQTGAALQEKLAHRPSVEEVESKGITDFGTKLKKTETKVGATTGPQVETDFGTHLKKTETKVGAGPAGAAQVDFRTVLKPTGQ